jgi:2-polyprenyl-3-methyl-5-hydroxy-6-metoxy-1,4-benzoquinol methylase
MNLLKIHSHTASKINIIRWGWVSQYKPKTVLDYGSGVGWFKAFAPEGIKIDNYDVMPTPQTGITLNHYDLITFWDVLEHIENLDGLNNIFNMAEHIAISVPICPDDKVLYYWKHYKPEEHVNYFTINEIE